MLCITCYLVTALVCSYYSYIVKCYKRERLEWPWRHSFHLLLSHLHLLPLSSQRRPILWRSVLSLSYSFQRRPILWRVSTYLLFLDNLSLTIWYPNCGCYAFALIFLFPSYPFSFTFSYFLILSFFLLLRSSFTFAFTPLGLELDFARTYVCVELLVLSLDICRLIYVDRISDLEVS
jgi:hypothetical protein